MKRGKKIIIICFCVTLLILVIFIFFKINMAKNLKIGNNKSSQEMVDNILNMKNYEAVIEVEVKSNKNQNKYIIKQN